MRQAAAPLSDLGFFPPRNVVEAPQAGAPGFGSWAGARGSRQEPGWSARPAASPPRRAASASGRDEDLGLLAAPRLRIPRPCPGRGSRDPPRADRAAGSQSDPQHPGPPATPGDRLRRNRGCLGDQPESPRAPCHQACSREATCAHSEEEEHRGSHSCGLQDQDSHLRDTSEPGGPYICQLPDLAAVCGGEALHRLLQHQQCQVPALEGPPPECQGGQSGVCQEEAKVERGPGEVRGTPGVCMCDLQPESRPSGRGDGKA
ncbi:PREDICTED: platelet-derived growth factor subunit A isoform X3 [Chinchilla lanigera]|uniref:platelet-derived growth factor subunit A isoform X3 n=1 Tax=Chinchilla lanigera TaxID=34839 RepID=UPI0006965158|nr:PREDICTED: platelet-derived growth factor subunit A isoform X3 [Chinchilla lanigera]